MGDTESQRHWLTRTLERAPQPALVAYAASAAFAAYFCTYAFRRPFAVATFTGESFLGSEVTLKTALVISQILGYALSKFIGIKVCSEVSAAHRSPLLVLLILWAELALLLYGWAPDDFKVLAIFLNGLPLGMVWGLIARYLEGRRTSDLLLATLSCSYIISSGVVKDVGRAILAGDAAESWATLPLIGPTVAGWMRHVSEGWMPAVTGLHFLPVFLLSVWLLKRLPVPNAADVAERVQRQSMDCAARMAFLKRFLPGIVLLCVAYLFLTGYRDFRDNFQVEILNALGYPYARDKTLISQTETLVTLGVLGALSLLTLVHDNRRGLLLTFALQISGLTLLGVGTLSLQLQWTDGYWWMVLTGLGIYLAYVPFGAVLFERLIASTGVVGTAVFGLYLADSVGYTGSVGIQLFKDLGSHSLSRLAFFEGYSYFVFAVGIVCLTGSCLYFTREPRRAIAEKMATETVRDSSTTVPSLFATPSPSEE